MTFLRLRNPWGGSYDRFLDEVIAFRDRGPLTVRKADIFMNNLPTKFSVKSLSINLPFALFCR